MGYYAFVEKSLMAVQQTQQQEGCISKAAPKRRTSWIKRSYIVYGDLIKQTSKSFYSKTKVNDH